MKRLRNALAVSILMVVGIGLVSPAYAFNLFGNACSTGGGGSAVCQDSGGGKNTSNPLVGSNGLLITIANIVAVIAGVIAVFMIILAGWQYVTSGGDANKVEGAKSTIIQAVVGLVIIAMADFIIGYVIGKL